MVLREQPGIQNKRSYWRERLELDPSITLLRRDSDGQLDLSTFGQQKLPDLDGNLRGDEKEETINLKALNTFHHS